MKKTNIIFVLVFVSYDYKRNPKDRNVKKTCFVQKCNVHFYITLKRREYNVFYRIELQVVHKRYFQNTTIID